MLSLRKFATFAAVAGVAAMGATAAHAGSESFTATYGPAETDWSGSPAILSIPQFSNSLGTLTSVELQFTGTVTSSGEIKNISSSSTASISSVTASINIYLMPVGYGCSYIGGTVVGSACKNGATTVKPYGLADSGEYMISLSQPVLATISNEQLAPGEESSFSVTNSTDTATQTLTTDLSEYEGAGDLVFPLGTLAYLTSGSANGNLSIIQTTTADASLKVTYNYTPSESPVPEPASLALLGFGLAGLGFVRSRKR